MKAGNLFMIEGKAVVSRPERWPLLRLMSWYIGRSILDWPRRTAFVSQSCGTLSSTSDISTPPDERAIPDAD
jgi:hypothetical protein